MTASAALLATAYDGITAAVADRSEQDLSRPSRCRGWTVRDVLFHVLLDAQRALMTFATPTQDPPDVDDVTYWAPHKPGAPWAGEHEDFVRRAAAAYSTGAGLVRHWSDTAAAATRAAGAAPSTGRVATQGHVLTVPSFVSTLVVEAYVHHLDLTVDLPAAPAPADDVAAHVRDVLDRMTGTRAPTDVATADYVLAATGRLDDPGLRAAFGAAADRFPLLG